MNRDWNAELDKIIKDTTMDKGIKFIKLYAIGMLNYSCQPIGDRAGEEIGNIIGKDLRMSFFYLCGFLSGGNHKTEDWLRLGRFEDEP